MIYAIFSLIWIFGLFCASKTWLSGKGFKNNKDHFGTYVGVSVVVGLLLVTTLTPPSSGLFGGVLFGIYLYRHLVGARNVLIEKSYSNGVVGLCLVVDSLFFILVSINYWWS